MESFSDSFMPGLTDVGAAWHRGKVHVAHPAALGSNLGSGQHFFDVLEILLEVV